MACVSLIVPIVPGGLAALGGIAGLHRRLSAAGHAVELLVVADSDVRVAAAAADADAAGPLDVEHLGVPVRTLVSERRGKAAAAYHGLGAATGDLLVIVDLEKGYVAEDLDRVLEPLLSGDADVVVAAHGGDADAEPGAPARRWPSRWLLDRLARPLIGITDPSTGLVAVTRASYQSREKHPAPLGSRFVLELLVGTVGRRREVAIRRGARPPRVVLGPSDLRLIKRLADDRFGNLSRLVQFCVVGASGMVIDLTSYALFQLVLSRTPLARMTTPLLASGVSLDLAVAGALAIALALVWNFSLNRRLTFNDARQGSIPRQFLTYALGNALGIALSFTLRLYLPGRIDFFRRHKLAAAVVGIVAATGISFSMSRWVVFSRRAPRGDRGPRPRHDAAALAER
jgi:dolichol-phosphate mannosyltransferase